MSLIILVIGIVFIATLGFVVAFGAPYVPSKRSDLKTAFEELYVLKKNDVVVDLGLGDGVVLREVSRRGARAVGYELNPLLVAISRFLSRHDTNVSVVQKNLWNAKFPDGTTVVYIFGESRDIARLERKVESEATRLKKLLFVISYGFELKGRSAIGHAGAHHKYTVAPLQPNNHKL